jgi:hypothetical protein
MKPNYKITQHPDFKLMPGMLVYTNHDGELQDHRLIDEYTAYVLAPTEDCGITWYCGDTELEPNCIVAVDIDDPATLGCLAALGFSITLTKVEG